jgi:signal transduction histidine kinase
LPFDDDLDLRVFEQFAPHGATACQRLIQLEKLRDQQKEQRDLARKLTEAKTLAAGFEALAGGAGGLADAAVAIVCRIDNEGPGQALYEVARWRHPDLGTTPSEHSPLHLHVVQEVSAWSDQVGAALAAQAELRFRRLLLPPTNAPEESRDVPRVAVILLDRPPVEDGPAFFSDELLVQFATSFVLSAETLLKGQGRALGSRLVDQLVGPQEAHSPREVTAEGVMAEATERLVELLGADAGLLYLGPPSDMRIAQTWPSREGLLGEPVAPRSRTEACIKASRAAVVVDALSDPQDLNQESLALIRGLFGWRAVRSWLCCPLLYQGRLIGLWKFLTRGSGRFLGPDHLEVVDTVAPHAAWEAQRAARSTMLSESLQLATALTGHHGQKLEQLLARELGEWTRRVLKRENARVAAIARLHEGRAFLRAASSTIAEGHREAIDRISLQIHGKAFGEMLGRSLPEPLVELAPFVIAEPIAVLGGGKRLAGHVFFLDDSAFDIEDREALQEVTRTLSVVLNAERERNELKDAMGRYRHAVLGPVQGAMSNALELVEQTTEAAAPELLAQTRAKLLEEVQILRLWRENQRFYQSERVELKTQMVPIEVLNTLIERAFQRYQEIAAARNIRLRLDGQSTTERPLRLPLDEHAMDLVVSNLVDNAVKYAFFNTAIKAGVARRGNRAELWVEDIGHGIERKVLDEIFDPGQRAVDFDPFRWITGSGLGLTLSRRIVEAHKGEITARSRELGPGHRAETTPNLVRFTVQLPLTR